MPANASIPTTTELLARMRPFYDTFRVGDLQIDGWLTLSLRAAFAKAFEFCVFVNSSAKDVPAFMFVSTLRGICEDLIVVRFLKSLTEELREALLAELTAHELRLNLMCQASFFDERRRHQTVIRPDSGVSERTSDGLKKLQSLWRAAGCNLGGKIAMPQTRQLAERTGVVILYDYYYRLTSKLVHFNPQVLLRSGWGDNLRHPHFSFNNFDQYYKEIAQTYGILLFCLFFEFFDDDLRAGDDVDHLVDQLRERILTQLRWPELVTWEEMNRRPPEDGKLGRLMYALTLRHSDTSLLASDSRRLS